MRLSMEMPKMIAILPNLLGTRLFSATYQFAVHNCSQAVPEIKYNSPAHGFSALRNPLEMHIVEG